MGALWSHKNILTACRDFYVNLYTAEPVDLKCQDWLLNQLDSTLTSEDQEKCEGALTLSECYEALSQMQTNKSPGADGFPVEFYRRFWSSLGNDLVEVLNYSYEHGQLSDSQKQGIIRLLDKKDDPLVSQYADDTTLILADNYSITQSFNLINIFERGSGSRLNAQKTEGLWLGSAAGKQTEPVNITWTTDKLKILGVYFGTSNVEHANWIDRIIKLEKRLNLW